MAEQEEFEAKTFVATPNAPGSWQKLDQRSPEQANRTDWPTGPGEAPIRPPATVEQKSADVASQVEKGLPETKKGFSSAGLSKEEKIAAFQNQGVTQVQNGMKGLTPAPKGIPSGPVRTVTRSRA